MHKKDEKEEQSAKKAKSVKLEGKKFSMHIDKVGIRDAIWSAYFTEYGYYKEFYKFNEELCQSTNEPASLLKEQERICNFAEEENFHEIVKTIQNTMPCMLLEQPRQMFSIQKQDTLETYIMKSYRGLKPSKDRRKPITYILENPMHTEDLENLVSTFIWAAISRAIVTNRSRVFKFKIISKAVLCT